MNSENDIPALCSLQGAPVAKQQTNAYGVCAMAIAEMLGYATKGSRCAELRSLHDKALFHKQALAKLKEPKVNHSALGLRISTIAITIAGALTETNSEIVWCHAKFVM